MGKAVAVTRIEHSAPELRSQAARCDDADQARRLLALAMVVDGRSREDAARLAGMDRQTLCDWVHRYNDEGIDGVRSRKAPGPSPKLTDEQRAELRQLVLDGPDPEIHKVVRWRCMDLRAEVLRRFNVTVNGRTVAKWLRRMELTRLQPRPFHPKKDAEAQEAKKNFRSHLRQALAGCTAATSVEIWFQDEAIVGQKGSLAYVWAPFGSRPPMVRDNRHDNGYIFGAICPDRATGAAIITPAANTECMNHHLAAISTRVAPGAAAAIICDGAGWHAKGKDLKVPANIVLVPLPPYAPELNSMENVWAYLRNNKLSAAVWNTYDEIVRACAVAWNWLMDDPDRIQSIGAREWASVNL